MSTIAKNLDEESTSMRRGGFAEILEDLAEEEKLNIEEIRAEALRIYFNLRPEFKEILASKGVIRETEGKEVPEMDRKIKEIFLSMRI
jgi:predicted nucleic-acid-binding protein